MGFDFSQNIKLFDSLNLHSDMFPTITAMKEITAAVNGFDAVRRVHNFDELFANMNVIDGLVKLDIGQSVVYPEFATTKLFDLQSELVQIIPDLTTQFRSPEIMGSIIAAGDLSKFVEPIPPITIGIADALASHVVAPDITADLRDTMRNVVQASDAMQLFRSDLDQISASIMANSGISTFDFADTTKLFGDTKFVDAMTVLVPQLPTLPDFAGLRLIANLNIDRDYLAFIEDRLLADQITKKAYRTAVTAIVQRLKVSRKKARKMVVGLVWLTWFSSLMALMLVGPDEAKVVAGAVLSATGRLNADSVATAVGNFVVKPRDDEE